MNAMTWWDHETDSMWSQPWGRGIKGTHKGVELNLLPFQLTTWGSWVQDHPDTLVMVNDADRLSLGIRQGFSSEFVIGLVLNGEARAYYFGDVRNAGLVNDQVGGVPVMLWAGEDNWYAYIRQVDDTTLNFRIDGGFLVDMETGTSWDIPRGIALSGPLKGQALGAVPSLSSFDWAFVDFYPDGDFYSP
jgi:hypothetical protein